ncbi:MAG: MFS transporter [Pseudomonadota bacterium]
MSDAPSYQRLTRAGPLPVSTKFYQGIGAIPDTLKNWVFNTFVLLFYNQILGMDAFLVSIALAVAMVFDAVTDPVVGSFSDNLRTRWGRRHPLMLIASIPLGLCVIAVFIPPDGLSHIMLFVWLTTFTVLTRGFMTLYFVPWSAIAAELSDDYNERTSIMMFRFAVGWTFGVGVPFIMLSTVMANTEAFPVGQLNPYAYPAMATWTALIMISGALATTLLTRREIPYLRQHVAATPPFRFGEAVGDMVRALKNRQFALVFTIVFISSAIGGTTGNIGIYMQTYFWGLTADDLRWFGIAALGAIVAFGITGLLQKRFDKKHILIFCSIVSLVDGIMLINLRLFDVLPDNGTSLLLIILVTNSVFTAGIGTVHGIIGASIVADILDDHELRTGYRQEGMFNAALSFSGKAVTGVGIVLGGLIISLIQLPTGVAPSDVSAEVIFRLGLVVGVLVPLLHIIPISLIPRYKLTRDVVLDIQATLADKREAQGNAQPAG